MLFAVGSPPSSLSCLQSLAVAAVGSSSLTPSLANHYRDDLVNHVRGWPADVCEKQVSLMFCMNNMNIINMIFYFPSPFILKIRVYVKILNFFIRRSMEWRPELTFLDHLIDAT